MLSKITIDVDGDNQPIIKIEYRYSDDVRDKLVGRFIETFANDSWFATFNHIGSSSDNVKSYSVRPLPVKDFKYHIEDFKILHKEHENSQQIVGSDTPIAAPQDLYETCMEDDPEICGTYQSLDGQSLAHVKLKK